MRRRDLFGTIFWTIIVIILAVFFAAAYFTTKFFVVQDWQLYPRNQEMLDLRDRKVSVEEYNALALQMLETKIVWHVPFHNMYVDSSLEEITVDELTATDVDMVEYLPDLKVIHAEQCQDYDMLKALFLQYPKVKVCYNVPVAGENYPSDTTAITLSSLTEADVQNMQYLPRLSRVNGTSCRDYALMYQVQREHPEWHVSFLDTVAGIPLDPEATSFVATGARYDELYTGLAAMANLKKVTLHDPKASGEELVALREEYPNVDIHWDLTFGGITIQDDVEELDISFTPVGSVDVAREIGSKFPKLTKLIVDSAGISNAEMGEYREEVRSQYKVVWTITFSSILSARTDTTSFMPTREKEFYFLDSYTPDLKYLEDVVAMDLGHHPIKNVEFLRYMPHIKYLVLADTQVRDLSPISGCKELYWLELGWSYVNDYTPLLECTGLRCLNLARTFGDPEPIKQMTWLENLWWMEIRYTTVQALIEALPDTHIEWRGIDAVAYGWRKLPGYYEMRDLLGMYYMD